LGLDTYDLKIFFVFSKRVKRNKISLPLYVSANYSRQKRSPIKQWNCIRAPLKTPQFFDGGVRILKSAKARCGIKEHE